MFWYGAPQSSFRNLELVQTALVRMSVEYKRRLAKNILDVIYASFLSEINQDAVFPKRCQVP